MIESWGWGSWGCGCLCHIRGGLGGAAAGRGLESQMLCRDAAIPAWFPAAKGPAAPGLQVRMH